jgi:hypothetical protein
MKRRRRASEQIIRKLREAAPSLGMRARRAAFAAECTTDTIERNAGMTTGRERVPVGPCTAAAFAPHDPRRQLPYPPALTRDGSSKEARDRRLKSARSRSDQASLGLYNLH